MKLFAPGPKGCEEFENWRTLHWLRAGRERIEAQWERFEPFCANREEFLVEFRSEFLARLWELHTFSVLAGAGCRMQKAQDIGPDILFEDDVGRVWVECVSAQRGTGPDRIVTPEIVLGRPIRFADDDPFMLRYLSSLKEKLRKFQKYAGGPDPIVLPRDRCIIAISGGELNQGMTECDLPVVTKAMFGLGEFYITINIATQTETGSGYKPAGHVLKKNGSAVPTNLVHNTEFSMISGIIHCAEPQNFYVQPGDNFHFTHNPLSKKPLPINYFPFGWEYYVDPGRYKSAQAEGTEFLLETFDRRSGGGRHLG